jgi:anti-anti-sigma factor
MGRVPARDAPRVQVVALSGAVALAEARQLERDVLQGVRQGRTRVVVDLREVTEVGPGLLGVLLRLRRGITGVDGRFALVVAGPPVADFVRTTVLAALIDVAASPEEARVLVA